jgi:hypothetical protein
MAVQACVRLWIGPLRSDFWLASLPSVQDQSSGQLRYAILLGEAGLARRTEAW